MFKSWRDHQNNKMECTEEEYIEIRDRPSSIPKMNKLIEENDKETKKIFNEARAELRRILS